jgi:AcrR family transcriptional regulator
MKARRDKILDVAVNLAEEGGFDNVRQRDVAAHAGVALGTLYKSFRSKEEILAAALEREAEVLERKMETSPAKGDTPLERVGAFFQVVTRGLLKKPNFARAVLRAMSSGEPEVAKNVASYYGRMNGLVIAALRGVGRLGFSDATMSPPTTREMTAAYFLLNFWFAELVGWSAGLVDEASIREHMKSAATILLRGIEDEP